VKREPGPGGGSISGELMSQREEKKEEKKDAKQGKSTDGDANVKN